MVIVSYTIVGSFTYWYIRKNAPKCKRANSKRAAFLLYYTKYVAITIALYTSLLIASLLSTYLAQIDAGDASKYHWILTIQNVVKVALGLTTLLYSSKWTPSVKKTARRGASFWRPDPEGLKNIGISLVAESGKPDTDYAEGMELSSTSMSTSNLNESYGIMLFTLSKDRKLELTYTFLSSILISRQYQTDASLCKGAQVNEHHRHSPFKHERTFQIDEENKHFDGILTQDSP